MLAMRFVNAKCGIPRIALPILSCFAACSTVMPTLKRARAAETDSAENCVRPGFRPRFLVPAIPSRVRSGISHRSNRAIVPKT